MLTVTFGDHVGTGGCYVLRRHGKATEMAANVASVTMIALE